MDKYIERKAIIEKLNEIGGCDASDDFGKGWDKAIDAAVKAVEKLPAADVTLVRHRRWIKFEIWCGDGKERKYYRCSECNKANVIRSNFCPNCGAKMDDEIRKD